LRAALQAGKSDPNGLTLAALREALAARGGEGLKSLMDQQLDQVVDTDLMIGLPQQRGGEWVSALRNTSGQDMNVRVAATTDAGQVITTDVAIPAHDFGEAHFRTAARLVRVEVDPEKLYPQIDYSNDIAPRSPGLDEALDEATRALGAGDYAKAETTARTMLQVAPLMQEARILLARALLEQNKLADAEREFRALLDDKLPLPATLAWGAYGLGEIAQRKGQAAEALKRYDEAARAEGGYAPTLAARAARLGSALRTSCNLVSGDRVAIVAKNCVAYLEALYGIWHAGLAAVLVNAKLHGAEIGYILAHSGARACFASRDIDAAVAPHAPQTLQHLITIGSDAYAALFAAEPVVVAPRAPESSTGTC
jgi:TolA-binding protein